MIQYFSGHKFETFQALHYQLNTGSRNGSSLGVIKLVCAEKEFE
jgi:hypothetical protein